MFLEHHISIFVISERPQDWSNDDALHFKITFFSNIAQYSFFLYCFTVCLGEHKRILLKKTNEKKRSFKNQIF